MELTGSVNCKSTPDKLWQVIFDMTNWQKLIPEGILAVEQSEPNVYDMTVRLDVGPLKGDKNIKVKLSDVTEPESFSFEIINDLIKTVKGSVEMTPMQMAPDIHSTLTYKLDLDAGNSFFNSMVEMYKGTITSGFEELLQTIDGKAATL